MDVEEIVEAFRLFLQDGTKVLDAGTDEEKKLLIRKFVREAVVDRDANRVRFSFYRLPPLPVCASYSDRGFGVDTMSTEGTEVEVLSL